MLLWPKKLDQALRNTAWFNNFNHASVEFLSPGTSNHCPVQVSLGDKPNFGPKPFKLFNYWADREDFLDWVMEAWDGDFYGSPMFTLYSKLEAVKARFKMENQNIFSCNSQS